MLLELKMDDCELILYQNSVSLVLYWKTQMWLYVGQFVLKKLYAIPT